MMMCELTREREHGRASHISSHRDVSEAETAALLSMSGEASNQSPLATSFQTM